MENEKGNLIIYVRDDEQRNEIQSKHPSLNAEFRNMKGNSEGIVPMVCINKNGNERCEIGEEFIDSFQKELESKED